MRGTILRKKPWVVETAALLDHQTPENARLNLEWTSRPGISHIANWANAVDFRPATQPSRFQSCILGSSGSRPRKMARRPREHDCRTNAVEKAPQVPPLFAPGSPERAATGPEPPPPRATFRSAKDPFAEAPPFFLRFLIPGEGSRRPRHVSGSGHSAEHERPSSQRAPYSTYASGSPERAATGPEPPPPRATFRSAKDPFAEAPQEQAKGSFMREDVARGGGGPGPNGKATPSRSPS